MNARLRSIWLSDIHLGTRECRASAVLDFLQRHDADYLYLVGDIIDFWRLRRTPYWPPAHSEVIRAVLAKARAGTLVTFIPGNHDEYLRRFCDLAMGGVLITREAVHRTADGRLLLVLHGDVFDSVTRCHRWLARTGDVGYEWLLILNRWINEVRWRLGLGYWSLAGAVKGKVKQAVSFISSYEAAVVREARRRGMQGVICGHIHKAELREVAGVLYGNSGDWVESCTALVEHAEGQLELVAWDSQPLALPASSAAASAARAAR